MSIHPGRITLELPEADAVSVSYLTAKVNAQGVSHSLKAVCSELRPAGCTVYSLYHTNRLQMQVSPNYHRHNLLQIQRHGSSKLLEKGTTIQCGSLPHSLTSVKTRAPWAAV